MTVEALALSRMEKIRQYRLRQPRAELERKALKAKERANLWTQEEFDAAHAEAKETVAYFAANEPPVR